VVILKRVFEAQTRMFYVVYLSTAVKPLSHDDLSALLRQCRDSNHKLGITGILLYQQGTFMQMLEGDKQAVLDLYRKIGRDPRHTAVHTVLDGEAGQRSFADWSMGFVNMDKAGDMPAYAQFFDRNLRLKSFSDDAKDAYDFMVRFNELSREMADITC
jgi:hypothetical protein